ncbi:hypothetical protein EON65_42045 [archaeon]|nr:MAG: hypothetical protein EON65_42045 [archaeon]
MKHIRQQQQNGTGNKADRRNRGLQALRYKHNATGPYSTMPLSLLTDGLQEDRLQAKPRKAH